MSTESTQLSDAATASESSIDEIELSIVMPCLNESETIEACIAKARRSLDDNGIRGEIIVADNGSSDGSQAIATRMGARIIDVAEKGYGSALIAGINAARGTYVIMGDSDDSYDFSALMPFVEHLRSGFDLVMGNRFRGGIRHGAMPRLHRHLGNPVLTGIGRLLFRSPCGDFHCGLRGFRRDFIMKLNLRTTGMEFASEMVVKATLFKGRITEVPTILHPDGRSRPPHLRSWRDGWRHLRFLLLYSPRWLFLYPGILMMAMGFLMGLWLLPGPRRIGRVELDVHTLLYSAVCMLVGFQSIAFAVFTKVFAITEGLLPPSPGLMKLFDYITLEVGLIIGGLLIVAGTVGTAIAVAGWGSESFGPLVPAVTLRHVIPSVVAIALGFQIVLSSLFLSVLGMRRR